MTAILTNPKATVRVHGRDVHFFFDEDSWVHNLMRSGIANGGYEKGTSYIVQHTLTKGGRFVDVGAHIGMFSCLAAAFVGDAGAVFAFEPDPVNFARLAFHKEYNGLRNIDLNRVVVGDRPALVDFYVNSDNDGGHAVWDPRGHHFNALSREHPVAPNKVIQVRLDDFPEFGAPDLVKIDTEGAELRVLTGADALLQRARPHVIAEVNPFGLSQLGDSEPDLVAFMEARGYMAFRILDTEPYATPRTPEDVDGDAVYNLFFAHKDRPTCVN